MQDLYKELIELLEADQALIIDDKLNKALIIDRALKLDPALIKLLLTHPNIKKQFFVDIEGILVFDKVAFQRFVNTKKFLKDSYTQYKNKIGLSTDNDHYITDSREVVLVWPHKDCVLEGGQTKEDAKRNEIFYNTTLAPDEIDVLTAPKVLTNWKRYDKDGETIPTKISKADNLIIRGNNLLALHTLKEKYRGQVKLIYIDPPYNTGNDSFGYNDNFNHSTWLTFMKNRLEVARELLKVDGSIWINVDDSEAHYIKCLGDEIFGRDNFIANVIWQKKYAPQNDAKFFSDNHDHIIVFAKNCLQFKINLLPRTEEMDSRYKNPDNDKRGQWKPSDLLVKTYSEQYDYPITNPVGREINPPNGSCWRVSKLKYQELLADNRIWFGKDESNVPCLKRFLSEVKQGSTPLTIWQHTEVGHNQDARRELFELVESNVFKTPKPEKLIQRIIQLGSNENDIVLDFFAGSGTTPAVALKMNRRFIACEQMDYCKEVTIERLKKVIGNEVEIVNEKAVEQLQLNLVAESSYKMEFDNGGISKSVNWHGGGSFIYAELMQSNEQYIIQIQTAKNTKQLLTIWDEMQATAFISYKVLPQNINKEITDFEALTFEDQQRFLVEILDKNLLYVNKSEINDARHKVSEADKEMNKNFYGM